MLIPCFLSVLEQTWILPAVPKLGKSNARAHRRRPSGSPSDLPKRSSSKPSTWVDGLVVFNNLDRPSAPKAWRLGLAVRRWAGLAAASEHPATMWLFHLPSGSSFRSADADRLLPNQCQSSDLRSRASGQSPRPYRRYCRDRACAAPTPKTIAAKPARTTCFVIIMPLRVLPSFEWRVRRHLEVYENKGSKRMFRYPRDLPARTSLGACTDTVC
jgi:hypothetical protein